MTTRSLTSGASAPRRLTRAATWLLRIVLAAIFLPAGLAKLGGDHTMVEMFSTIGVGQWLRYAVGACEVAGAVGVLIPRVSVLAAGGLALLMVGATLTDVAVLDASPAITLPILLLAALTVWLGRSPGRSTADRDAAPATVR